MPLGTKNRQRHTADLCKQHLREKYKEHAALVEEYIQEFEGPDQDIKRWGEFTDIKQDDSEMLQRLDVEFEKWLNP